MNKRERLWRVLFGLLLAAPLLMSVPASEAQQAGPNAPQPAAPAPEQSQAAPNQPTQRQPTQNQGTPIVPAGDEPRQSGVGPLHEMSPWSMFLAADIVVKTVMIGLVIASLVTWTMLIAKTLQLTRAQKQVNAALARLAKARSLSDAQAALGSVKNVITDFLTAAIDEVRVSSETGTASTIKERVASRFAEITRVEARAARHGMAVIATIGATAPFVGLFGTVWGIMNSFIGISKAQTTNLAVVAPGIAQALLATAIGLGAAIPAVVIYNHFSRTTKAYMDIVARGSGAVGRLLSRDLDRVRARPLSSAAE
jgi:biopolymer transport protein ExbB